ncbi:MAG: hypothetical protein QM786_00910 [Breznakibacter sp.]
MKELEIESLRELTPSELKENNGGAFPFLAVALGAVFIWGLIEGLTYNK